MLKKRLIFVLYFDSGSFFLSRNFRLQRVGDVRWLVEKFGFKSIGEYIDEIIVLDVSRSQGAIRCGGQSFTDSITYLMRETFVPLTLGGGIRNLEDARRCFASGADKILLNTPILQSPEFVQQCVKCFGAQAIIGSIDVIRDNDTYVSKIANGQQMSLPLEEHLKRVVKLGIGEIMINSIDCDGTGMGFDMNLINHCLSLNIPLIVSGGAGKPDHFSTILSQPNVEAAATGNLFNFIGKGFKQVRHHLLEQKIPVRNVIC